jgi:hypothetical protein
VTIAGGTTAARGSGPQQRRNQPSAHQREPRSVAYPDHALRTPDGAGQGGTERNNWVAIATPLKATEGTQPEELIMSINCDVVLQWSAPPEQLRALGDALWRWCTRAAGDTGIYRYLDNQALADLIAGTLPASSQTERRGVHFRVRDEASHDRQGTIDSLRREISAEDVEDIVVAGTSWNLNDCRR